jgi:siroheme synthase (precorrin-2 oxidase/ferrochelatase)
MEVMTQTDADGAFVIDVKSNDKYLLIIGQGDESLAKWFLKIETLKKDGGKYLFSNQNSILSKDTRQVIEVSVDDSVSIVMNKNDTRLKK